MPHAITSRPSWAWHGRSGRIRVGPDQQDRRQHGHLRAAAEMHSHKKGEIVSVEWIRERWYVDADFGTTFWHDHVFGLDGWGHGFYSTFIAEPPRSTYHDPMTGKEVRSGPVADIHTLEPVSAHIRGSFREIVTQVMDSNPRTAELITADNPQVRVGAISVDGTPTAVYPAKLNLSPMKFLNGGEATTGEGTTCVWNPCQCGWRIIQIRRSCSAA